MSTFYSPTGNAEVWEEKPDGYLTVEEWQATLPPPPAPTLAEARAAKLAEISAAYEAALIAALTMPAENPTPLLVAVETSALLAVDPDAVDSLKSVLDSRRQVLTQAVQAATSPEEVNAIMVTFPI